MARRYVGAGNVFLRWKTASAARCLWPWLVISCGCAALSPEHLREISGFRQTIAHLVCSIAESGVATDQFHTPEPRLTSAALLSLCVDITRWYRDSRRWSPEEVAVHCCQLALRMVSADPARGRAAWQGPGGAAQRTASTDRPAVGRRGAATALPPSGAAGPATDGGAW